VAIIRKVLAPTGGHLKPAPAVTAHSDGSPAGQWRLRLTNWQILQNNYFLTH